jgi:hypothetical protein
MYRLYNEKGAVMMAVIVLAVIASVLFIGLFFSVSSTVKRTGNNRVKTAVLNIAEAGKEHAISLFRSGTLTPVGGTLTTILSNVPFGSGSYNVQCKVSTATDTVWILSTATVGNMHKTIQESYLKTCPAPTDPAYNYGIASGGAITWSGSGTCNAGSAQFQCNGQFSMSGSSNFYCSLLSSSTSISMSGSGDINGNVMAPSISKNGSGKITGTSTQGAVPVVSIPVIDLTPYYNIALANGQVYTNKSITGSSSTIVPGGVMWVNGDFNYSGSGDVNGSIIATGNISISGSGNFTAASTYPALASSGGDIDMSGSGKVSGLIYAGIGDVTKSGSGEVAGSMICGGTFTKSGGWSVFTYKNSAPIPPGGCTGGTYSELAWQEL